MEIYILRHGIAEAAKPGQTDADRRLTPEGKQKLRKILPVAQKAGVQPDVVLASPYERAIETAQLACEILEAEGEIIRTEALVPMERPEAAWDEIRTYKDARQILLVGHEPHVSALVHYLTGGNVAMKKGAIARVDVDALGPKPSGTLVWLLTARLAGA